MGRDLAAGGGGCFHRAGGDGSSSGSWLVSRRPADKIGPLPGLRSLGCDGVVDISSNSSFVGIHRKGDLGLHDCVILSPEGLI
jgi:hypothetical protein